MSTIDQILLEKGLVTSEQVEQAKAIKKKSGGLIGIILLELGYITESQLIKSLNIKIKRSIKSEQIN